MIKKICDLRRSAEDGTASEGLHEPPSMRRPAERQLE